MTRTDPTDLAAFEDDDLALALQAGNEAAFDALVKRHQGRVYAVAYRVTLNREDALDVAQEAFVKAYRKIHSWKPGSGFVPWLMRLTTNQAIDSLRRQKRHRHESLDRKLEQQGSVMPDNPVRETDRQAGAHEIGERVEQALVVLSPSQRAVFAMRHYDGLQLSEIADALGCTVGSVKVHLFRALKKMQVELSDLREE